MPQRYHILSNKHWKAPISGMRGRILIKLITITH